MTATEIQIQIESTKAEADSIQELLNQRKRLMELKAALERPQSPLMAIVIEVCMEFQVTPEQIFKRRRTDRVCLPRHIAMTIMRELTNMTLSEIGEFFGRDHGTVLHAMRRVEALEVADKATHLRVCELRRRISINCDLGVFGE